MSSSSAATGSRGPTIDASLWILQSVSSAFLGLRIYCKVFRRRGLWWDDYIIIASWLFLLISASATTANVRLGFGEHFAQFPPGNLESYGILSLASGTFSVLSNVTAKTSFAVTLLRISEGRMRILVWGIIVSLNILMPLSAIFLWVSCNPPAKIWKPYLPGTCWDSQITLVYGIVVGAYAAACDFALALLPWKILLRFEMYRREKIGVAIAMSMGVFAGATAIVKSTMLPLLSSPDFTYDGTPFVIWGFAESAVTIMAASIPAMRALFREVAHPRIRTLPSLQLSSGKRTDSNPSASNGDLEQPVHNEKSDRFAENLEAGRSGGEKRLRWERLRMSTAQITTEQSGDHLAQGTAEETRGSLGR